MNNFIDNFKTEYLSVIMIYFLIPLYVTAQDKGYWTEIDTIQIYSQKILVHYRTYKDSTLLEDAQAFLYPRSIEVPKFKLFPCFFKETIPADSIVLHGIVKSYFLNGRYRIGKYQNGSKINMTYYDTTGIEITRQKFYLGYHIQWDPEDGTNSYFVKWNRKRRFKRNKL